MTLRFNKYLEHYVIHAKRAEKIREINFNVPGSLVNDLPEITRLDGVHKGVEDFYRNVCDGYGFEWWLDKEEGIGGNIQLAETKHLFANTKSLGIYDEETDKNDDIRFFHPLDYPTPESYVGFVIKPETIYKSLYYISISDYKLNNLDLDFEGYTQMAVESCVFYHWQVVLLDYMNGAESSVAQNFKTEMPKIFPDWTWENFIEKFESLRLSNLTK